MKKISTKVTLHPDMLAWLKLEAEKRHSSLAQVVRTIVLKEMAKD